jgi:Na+:H+ antiporter, NhaC family
LQTDTPKASRRREPSMVDALTPIVILVGLLSLSYILFHDEASYGPNQLALLFCSLAAAALAYKNGLPWKGIQRAMVEGAATGIGAIGILLAVGALIGTWALSGTIVAMVYYGLEILSPNHFYATAALICAAVAFSIGSSWTTAGTIGIGLMGIAGSMDLSLEITAGAVISGPISATRLRRFPILPTWRPPRQDRRSSATSGNRSGTRYQPYY